MMHNTNTCAPLESGTAHSLPCVKAVIGTVRELTEIMGREVELLRAMKVREFGQMQERKNTLVESYEKLAGDLKSSPAFAESIDPRLKDELRDVTERMHSVMEQNARAIQAAQSVNQRIANAIVEAVQGSPAHHRYSPEGAMTANTAAPPVSVQVDQVS
ncbi:MAG: hypothetical protein AAF530_05150 [Pseudomonadota bacterium]